MPITEREIEGKLTLAQYLEYRSRPWWQHDVKPDGEPFDTEEEWEAHWVKYVEQKLVESRSFTRSVKEEWARVTRRFEQFSDRNARSPTQKDPSETQVPFTYLGVSNRVALLCDSLPRPIYTARQANQDEYISGLNYNANWEYDANHFDFSMYDLVTDIQLSGLGVLKFSFDGDQSGPGGKPGRILVRAVEPRFCHPDPFAKHFHWDYVRWFIVAEPYDVAEVRGKYKDRAADLSGEDFYAAPGDATLDKSETYAGGASRTGGVMISPANIGAGAQSPGIRERVVVKEMWLKDESMIFVAEEEDIDNTNEDGERIVADEYRTYTRPMVDDDGYVVGRWEKRFPTGRVLVVANGQLLMNDENPFDAGIPPYVFFGGRLSKQLVSAGIASFVMVMDRKLNDLLIRMTKMAQASIERPSLADTGLFDAPKRWSQMQYLADVIMQVRNGGTIRKPEIGEIPAFILPLFQTFFELYHEVIAIPSIMKGQLVEGSQVGTETMGNLQESAAAQLRMCAKFVNEGLKETGFLMMWFIRQFYPDTVPVPGQEKDGTQKAWHKDKSQDDYSVEIEAGSSLPGAKEGAYRQAMELYRNDIIDDEAVLDAAKYPQKDRILKRKNEKRQIQINQQIIANKMGMSLKNKDKSDGRPGRRGR